MSSDSENDHDPRLDREIIQPAEDEVASTDPADSETGKEAGNKKFKEGLYEEAIKLWSNSLRSCEYIINKQVFEGEKLQEILELRRTLWANMSMGHLKMERFSEAVQFCDKVLREEATNVKVLFRKANALFSVGSYQEAKEAIQKLLTIDPSNAAVKDLQNKVDVAFKKYANKSKKMMGNILTRLETDVRTVAGIEREEEALDLHEVVAKRAMETVKERTPPLTELDGSIRLLGSPFIDAAIAFAYVADCTPKKMVAKCMHKAALVAQEAFAGLWCRRRNDPEVLKREKSRKKPAPPKIHEATHEDVEEEQKKQEQRGTPESTARPRRTAHH